MTGNGALLNLVRRSPLSDVVDHDYVATSELDHRFDEIRLETPEGEPCAVPTRTKVTKLDPRFAYLTGNRGHSALVHLRNPSINIDYIGHDVAARLDRWMHQRATVQLCPNIGRHTVYSWRPCELDGGDYASGNPAYDMTGNSRIEEGSVMPGVRLWDGMRRFVTKPVVSSPANKLWYVDTPGGAGFGYPRDAINRWEPDYPKGASLGGGSGATASGWSIGGTDAADVTFTHNPNGFGPADCPDSLIIDVAANASADRYLLQRQIWDSGHALYSGYTWTSNGTVSITIWLKGRLPDLAKLKLSGGSTGGDLSEVDLGGVEFADWTPVNISYYDTDWGANLPSVTLDLGSTDDAPYRFECGAMAARHRASSHQSGGAHWSPFGVSHHGASVIRTTNNFQMPSSGTMIASFYVPEDWYARDGYQHSDILGSTQFALGVGKTTAGGTFVQYSQSGNTLFDSSDAVPELIAGSVNTVAMTWGTGGEFLFVNGELAATFDRSAAAIDFWTTLSPFYVGSGYGTRGCWPLTALTARVDAVPMTALQVANTHLALTDPIALQFARAARGRFYRITGVPTTVRESAGGSQILGSLKLEQVEYNHDYADPMNREENVT